MEDVIKVLQMLQDDLKKERPKSKSLSGGSGYRNGFEDGYQLVVKRVKEYMDELRQSGK